MTHDELLAKIDTPNGEFDAGDPTRHHLLLTQNKALRAVVELPKETNWDGGWEDADAFQHGYRLAMSKVIQAIEKELK